MEYFLADRLGLIVEEMRDRMTHAEFVLWSRFHARHRQREQVGIG